MELSYDKAALQEYMDDISGVGESLRRAKDESFTLYNFCKQQYTRLLTEIEQANRKAYNMVEAAESMKRVADANYELAMHRLENAEDDSERESAREQLRSAQASQAEASHEISVASVAYARAQANMKKLTDVWEHYQPSVESAAHRVEDGLSSFNTLMSNGNSDLGEYMDIMDKAQASLYDSVAVPTSSGESADLDSRNGNKGKQDSSSYSFKSKAGNILAVASTAGVASIVVNVAGKKQTFKHSKAGAAKAYRVAVESGDDELVAQTNLMFTSFDAKSNFAAPNQQYVANAIDSLEAGLPGTFDKEMVIAGSQGRRLSSPTEETADGTTRGTWAGTTFVLDDDYVPEKYNDKGLTVAQIKADLSEQYGIHVDGIPYVDGVADFSGISVANIPTADIVTKATGMSSEEYAALSQRERTEVFQRVFSNVQDGKNKRELNFDFADQIAAERQIPIPGLPDGYTASDLKEWRSKHKFSWDEQVNGGYNLVPTIIHGNVSHTGLVSTSAGAHTYLEQRDADMKLHPEKFSWDEGDAPISIAELRNKEKQKR